MPASNRFDAFPRNPGAFEGMQLRDYFAARAMAELLQMQYSTDRQTIARASYLMADAMMKERKNDQG